MADLHSALERLQGRARLIAELDAEVWNAAGEGRDRFETEGAVAITLTEGEDGFGVRYDNETLRRIDAER